MMSRVLVLYVLGNIVSLVARPLFSFILKVVWLRVTRNI